MNPEYISEKGQQNDVKQEYINYLKLQASNNQRNLDAKRQEEEGTRMLQGIADNRTTTEKEADIERLKVELRKELTQIMDGINANRTVGELDNDKQLLIFVANRIKKIIDHFKPLYRYGVSYVIFMNYVRALEQTSFANRQRTLGMDGLRPGPRGRNDEDSSDSSDSDNDDDNNNNENNNANIRPVLPDESDSDDERKTKKARDPRPARQEDRNTDLKERRSRMIDERRRRDNNVVENEEIPYTQDLPAETPAENRDEPFAKSGRDVDNRTKMGREIKEEREIKKEQKMKDTKTKRNELIRNRRINDSREQEEDVEDEETDKDRPKNKSKVGRDIKEEKEIKKEQKMKDTKTKRNELLKKKRDNTNTDTDSDSDESDNERKSSRKRDKQASKTKKGRPPTFIKKKNKKMTLKEKTELINKARKRNNLSKMTQKQVRQIPDEIVEEIIEDEDDEDEEEEPRLSGTKRKNKRASTQAQKRKKDNEIEEQEEKQEEKQEEANISRSERQREEIIEYLRNDNPDFTMPGKKMPLRRYLIRIKNENTIEDIHEMIFEKPIKGQKEKSGKGFSKSIKKNKGRDTSGGIRQNVMFGMGVKVHRQQVVVDNSKAVPSKEVYIPFGRYILNEIRLSDGILMIRTPKGGAIKALPTQKVSKKLQSIIDMILNKKNPSFEDMNDLTQQDKELLHSIVYHSRIQNTVSVPMPDKCEVDRDLNQFEILRGEMVAGNDSPKMIKEFKTLILKLINNKRLPRNQGTTILMELTALGY